MTSGTQNKNTGASGSNVPDGGWGWIIVLSSFMIHFIMDGITYSMGDVFLRPMMDNLNKTRGPVSTIFGILPAITLATGPIATIFTNTYGCRKVTIVGSCLAAFGFLISYLWANIWFYYLSIGIIGGIGFGLIYLPAIVSVGFYFERKRSFAMGIAVCGSGLGTLAFPAIMPYIISAPLWFDYEGALLLEAAIVFICVIFGAFMVNRLTLYNTTLIIAGISTMFAPFCNSSVATHMIYASLFGFFSGGYVGLTSIIIVDLVGVDKLSDAFGVLLLFQGIAVAIGTPVVGSMRDNLSDLARPYLWPYLIFGGSILLSGLILFAIPILKRRQERQQKLTKHQLQMGVLSFSKQDLSAPEQQQQI
ncbi:unnamed protein product [Rotaria socialis]|uniref:Major facilitator superfamily (MFS) profile domain-containing protein n=1 Tax=Rotaria socialis TaxID=392032 RepID=A0A820T9P1_9BILA|nr:unnamed protein product [Rotaria socialis]